MSWWQESTPVGDTSNLTKFLSFLSQAEGADYNTIVGGSRFNSFDAHPGVVGLRTKEGPSTAAGRYQITKTTYDDVAPRLGIKDFSPQSQDAIATELIRRGKAYDDVISGNFESAINKLGSTWASLPSSPYSQPKKSWADVNKMLGVQVASNNASNNWWAGATPVSDAPSKDNWWAGATPVQAPEPTPTQAAPLAAPAVAPQPAKASTPQPKKEEPRSILRRVDDFVRGVADTATFGYADEIAGKLDSLFGGGQSGKKTFDEAVKAQRQRDSEGGGARLAGQFAGAVAPTIGVVRAVDGATKMARAGAGALTGAIQGGLYGTGSAEGDLENRLKEGATGAGIGAAVGGVGGLALSALVPTTVRQEKNRFVRRAGSDDLAKIDAEVVLDLNDVFQREVRTQGGKQRPSMAIDANAVATRYINEAKDALGKLDPKTVPNLDEIAFEIANKGSTPSRILDQISQTPAGKAVVDAMLKADRVRTLTGQQLSAGGALGAAARIGVEASPAILSATTGVPAYLPRAGMDSITNKLGASVPRAKVIDKLLSPKQVKAAEAVAGDLGASGPTQSLAVLKRMADEAQITKAAEAAQRRQERLTKVTAGRKEATPQVAIAELRAKDPTYMLELSSRFGAPRNATEMSEFSKVIQDQMEARAQRSLANREVQKTVADLAKGPKVDPRIQVLQDSRRPLSGAFQELLQGGRSGLNMNSDQAIDALRLTSRQFKDRPLGQAAQDILRSGNVNDEAAFYGLQNQLRKLQERGVLGNQQQGALSAATSNIRNPVSYAEAVRTAGEAANLARASAPTKELAQFATKVAGIKSPADKAKAVADRLAKSNDPAEQAFLTQFVEPLAQFGKK
jgi:muramidase (phage lysozyme)